MTYGVAGLILASCADSPTGTGPTKSWTAVGSAGTCEIREESGSVEGPALALGQCTAARVGWEPGPVEAWAQALILGEFVGDQMGTDLEAVDPEGDGTSSLVVGAPHPELPPTGTGYTYLTHPPPTAGPRVHLLSDVRGTILPENSTVIASERNVTESIGSAVDVLTETGPILVGDYWSDRDPGRVLVIDASEVPVDVAEAPGEEGETCGADVAAADVDGSGTADIVTACLRRPLEEVGRLRVFHQDSAGGYSGLAWLDGTVPYAWFGRPTVGGFDLDGDGLSELAIGEQHVGPDLESVVHLISGPWRGHCTLQDLDANRLWNGFSPAMFATGDLDGNGVPELVVTDQGMPAWGLNPEATLGWVRVLRGPVLTDEPVQQSSWLSFEGVAPEEGFGAEVAVGDFNGDGCADVAVGAPGFDLNEVNPPGRVYVFDGPFVGGTIGAADADVVLEGSADGDWFGYKLAVGDFDGDEIDDLAVAAVKDSRIAREAGAVYVLAGVPGER